MSADRSPHLRLVPEPRAKSLGPKDSAMRARFLGYEKVESTPAEESRFAEVLLEAMRKRGYNG